MEIIKRNLTWKIFFFYTGITGLLTWNSIISVNDYSINKTGIKNILNYLTIGYSIGTILSFFINELFFKKLILYKKLIFYSFMIFLSFFLWFFVTLFCVNEILIKILGTFIFFFNGLFSFAYQSVIIGLASSIDYKEIFYYNNGNTFTAIISNLIVLIIYLINEKIRQTYKFYLIYLIILVIYMIHFYYNFIIFFKKNGWYISKKLHQKTIELKGIQNNELGKFKVNKKHLIFNNLDLIFGIFFTYTTSIVIFPNFYYQFDIRSVIGMPIIFLSFALFDFLGRFIPEKLIFKNIFYTNIYCILRLIFFVISIIFSKNKILVNKDVKQIIFYIFLFGLISFTNGHLTMSFFSISKKRYIKNDEQNYGGKLILLGIFLGIFFGVFINLVSN